MFAGLCSCSKACPVLFKLCSSGFAMSGAPATRAAGHSSTGSATEAVALTESAEYCNSYATFPHWPVHSSIGQSRPVSRQTAGPDNLLLQSARSVRDATDAFTVDRSGNADQSQVAASREFLLGKEDLQRIPNASGSDQEQLNTAGSPGCGVTRDTALPYRTDKPVYKLLCPRWSFHMARSRTHPPQTPPHAPMVP